jgi:hypothetical protein
MLWLTDPRTNQIVVSPLLAPPPNKGLNGTRCGQCGVSFKDASGNWTNVAQTSCWNCGIIWGTTPAMRSSPARSSS